MEQEYKIILGLFGLFIIIFLIAKFGKSDPKDWPDYF